MKHYLFFLNTILFIAVVWMTGCSMQEAAVLVRNEESSPPTTPGGSVTDYVSLIDSLRAAGATVEPAGEVSQPFFSVKGQLITVNGSDVQVFEYADEPSAKAEAALVSSDGSSVGTTMISWVAPPHFYQKGKLLVLYTGDNPDINALLEIVLGPQFAGR